MVISLSGRKNIDSQLDMRDEVEKRQQVMEWQIRNINLYG
jgi:hypothetical protein